MNPAVLVLSDDLIFSSRITGVARDHGIPAFVSRGVEAAVERLSNEPTTCVILDLAVAGNKLGELIAALKALPQKPRIVAYGSHVDTASLRAAAEVGCDVVLPRSRFVDVLPSEFAAWATPKAAS